MKKLFLFYTSCLFLMFLINSCKKDNEEPVKESLISSISGKFNNWTFGMGCKIIVCQYNTETFNFTRLDSSEIDINGNFDIKLNAIPQLQDFNFGDSVQISKSNVKMSSGMLWLRIFKNNELIKQAFYGKKMHLGEEPVAGDFGMGYVYVDNDIAAKSLRKMPVLDINLSKGWNKIVQRYTTATRSFVSTDFSEENLQGASWINY